MLQELRQIFGKHILRPIIAYLILYPVAYRNYRRRIKDFFPDEWYWADELLIEWGYTKRKDIR